MKINNLTSSMIAALLVSSPFVHAQSDYPASDFQPKVVYQDADAKSNGSKTTAPAEAAGTAKSASSSTSDAQYPATDFQPKVLYKDEGYKPSPSAAPAPPTAKKPTVAAMTTTDEGGVYSAKDTSSSQPTTAPKAEAKSNNLVYLLGLGVLGFAGFMFFKKKSECPVKTTSTPAKSYRNTAALTGVAKYVNRVSGTGVARYVAKLDKQVKAAAAEPATGVAKYMAKKVEAVKETTQAGASTGVANYLKNRRS